MRGQGESSRGPQAAHHVEHSQRASQRDNAPRSSGLAGCREFQVELEAGDAVAGSAQLPVHAAEVSSLPRCGQHGVALTVSPSNSVTRPELMPATGFLIGTPASISGDSLRKRHSTGRLIP